MTVSSCFDDQLTTQGRRFSQQRPDWQRCHEIFGNWREQVTVRLWRQNSSALVTGGLLRISIKYLTSSDCVDLLLGVVVAGRTLFRSETFPFFIAGCSVASTARALFVSNALRRWSSGIDERDLNEEYE